ncbi:hypothetical protein CLV47_10155 [Antricoccus suffuscus]|uniref:Uncharacterized protein n=1 Tax=Antricoccus suffuscus TaxID=1629062 RepID=A0A2T1A5Q3_9ACTN|nr:hypothetical protein [Antricoccus suffuscus]PRZ43931.1 hypothetical protein CLV47_10155 [Antricoccus suffuscus]
MTVVPESSYIEALLGELGQIEERYVDVVEHSETYYSNPNRPVGTYFIGAADYSWKASDPALEATGCHCFVTSVAGK